MPRIVVIHDPRVRPKSEIVETPVIQGPPKPIRGKVYIILNTVEGKSGAHVAGTFADPNVPVEIVRSLSGNQTFVLGGTPAQIGDSMWEIVTSEVIEATDSAA